MTASDCSEPDAGSSRGPSPRRLEDLERRFHDRGDHIDKSPVTQERGSQLSAYRAPASHAQLVQLFHRDC